MQIDHFLACWRNAGGSERANYQPFIAERFTGKGQRKKPLPQLLGTLVALGRGQSDDGRFGASK